MTYLCITTNKCIERRHWINNDIVIYRAIHGSIWVEFAPNPESTRWNRVEKKGTRRRPAEVIGSGGSEHQWVASGSVGFETARKWWKKHRSDENLTGFDEISPNPVKISPDLRETEPESRKISSESRFFHRNLEILAEI